MRTLAAPARPPTLHESQRARIGRLCAPGSDGARARRRRVLDGCNLPLLLAGAEWLAALAAVLAPLPGCAHAPAPQVVERGVVAAPESLAAEVGAAILRRGGNAVDAAIAVHFALAVTFPSAGNLGGGGFMLVHTRAGDEALDFRETAPAAATRDMYLDSLGEVVPGASLDTHRAAGVPGSVAGLWLAHRRHGTLPWKDLVAPAVALAEDGFALSGPAARSFAAEPLAGFRAYFHGDSGSRLRQPELAATLRRIARDGRDGFYRGETARLIAAEMERGGGLVTLADLERYQPRVRTPVTGTYRGLRVVSMPPPSSGGPILIEMLHMLEGFALDSLRAESPTYVHLVAEIEKRVFADRAAFLGDADFVRVPVDSLVSRTYAARRRDGIVPDRRTVPAGIHAGDAASESEQTTHFSIVDRQGNAVACTTTLNDAYGSRLVVRGAGFLLNNEMDDFSARPGAPNLYGVTGGEANAIAPGKRMLSSMCPTLVFRDGALWLVLGTPGGPTIFTTVFQVIVDRVDFGRSLAEAVAAPRFHHQWPPRDPALDALFIEADRPLPPATRAALAGLGYAITPRERLGDVHAIEIAGGHATGVSDPRGVGRVAEE